MDTRQIRDEIDDYSTDHINYLIEQYIHSERNRAIVRRNLIDDIIFEDLETEFGLSVRALKDIVYKGMAKIFKHIND